MALADPRPILEDRALGTGCSSPGSRRFCFPRVCSMPPHPRRFLGVRCLSLIGTGKSGAATGVNVVQGATDKKPSGHDFYHCPSFRARLSRSPVCTSNGEGIVCPTACLQHAASTCCRRTFTRRQWLYTRHRLCPPQNRRFPCERHLRPSFPALPRQMLQDLVGCSAAILIFELHQTVDAPAERECYLDHVRFHDRGGTLQWIPQN